MKKRIRWEIEVTDTFGGEANYAWVERYTFETAEDASDRSIVIAAKKAAGMTGVKCDTESFGDMIQLDVRGACIRAFITYLDDAGD